MTLLRKRNSAGTRFGRGVGRHLLPSFLDRRRATEFLLGASVALFGPTANAQDFRTGTVAERYTLRCANCHGRNLEGSSPGTSLLKDTWLYGGDELNLVRRGANYGWPVISYGMNYDGTTLTELTAKEGMEQPIASSVPSLATCGINVYTGDLFPKWKSQLFLASLAAEQLLRIEIAGGKVISQEVISRTLAASATSSPGPTAHSTSSCLSALFA